MNLLWRCWRLDYRGWRKAERREGRGEEGTRLSYTRPEPLKPEAPEGRIGRRMEFRAYLSLPSASPGAVRAHAHAHGVLVTREDDHKVYIIPGAILIQLFLYFIFSRVVVMLFTIFGTDRAAPRGRGSTGRKEERTGSTRGGSVRCGRL